MPLVSIFETTILSWFALQGKVVVSKLEDQMPSAIMEIKITCKYLIALSGANHIS